MWLEPVPLPLVVLVTQANPVAGMISTEEAGGNDVVDGEFLDAEHVTTATTTIAICFE